MDSYGVLVEWWFSGFEAPDHAMLLYRFLTLCQWLLALVLLLLSLSCGATIWKLEGARTWLPARLTFDASPAPENTASTAPTAGETLVRTQIVIHSPGILAPILLAAAALMLLWMSVPTMLPEIIVDDPERLLTRFRS